MFAFLNLVVVIVVIMNLVVVVVIRMGMCFLFLLKHRKIESFVYFSLFSVFLFQEKKYILGFPVLEHRVLMYMNGDRELDFRSQKS